ncbi:MAG: hypothetical protein C0391_05725 [Anaerolinea sp.]|nr:hypothetical protein [Anaerolinea sp.]
MPNFPKNTTRFPFFRRLWKPVVATGTGGTALVIWFEEIVIVTEFIGLFFIPILVAIIYIFNIIVFKSFRIKVDDLKKYRSNKIYDFKQTLAYPYL